MTKSSTIEKPALASTWLARLEFTAYGKYYAPGQELPAGPSHWMASKDALSRLAMDPDRTHFAYRRSVLATDLLVCSVCGCRFIHSAGLAKHMQHEHPEATAALLPPLPAWLVRKRDRLTAMTAELERLVEDRGRVRYLLALATVEARRLRRIDEADPKVLAGLAAVMTDLAGLEVNERMAERLVSEFRHQMTEVKMAGSDMFPAEVA